MTVKYYIKRKLNFLHIFGTLKENLILLSFNEDLEEIQRVLFPFAILRKNMKNIKERNLNFFQQTFK